MMKRSVEIGGRQTKTFWLWVVALTVVCVAVYVLAFVAMNGAG